MKRSQAGSVWAAAAILLAGAAGARAQQPTPGDTIRPAAADTTQGESLEAIEARLLGELGAADSTPGAGPAARPSGGTATLNPDVSLIADFRVDLSPEESTLEDGDRFRLQEIEIGIQGAVDPYFRYDAFLGLHDGAIEAEEAYATTLALPARLQAKVGKFLLPFGKTNLTHPPEQATIDPPLAIQEFFGEEGFSSAGVWASVVGAPLGVPQELALVVADGAEPGAHAEAGTDAAAERAPRPAADGDSGSGRGLLDDLADRLWLAHLKTSVDFTRASNLEVGLSWATSAVDGPRTNLYGVDATWRWKPPERAKYRSALLQAEAYWRRDLSEPDPRFGAFALAQWQLARRWHVGARFDTVEGIEAAEGTTTAGQALLRFFPTEFSQIRLAVERRSPEHDAAVDRVLVQTTFALGPHRPHAY